MPTETRLSQLAGILSIAKLFDALRERGRKVSNLFAAGRARDERLDRHRPLAVPVVVEASRRFAHHWTKREHIEVREVHLAMGVDMGVEVLVAEVTPAHDGGGVVRDPQLVVHAAVQPRAAADELEEPRQPERAAREKGIEDAHLDVRMHREGGKIEVLADGVHVVHQQPHPHAAVGCPQRLIQQQLRGHVLADDVVLQIERALGSLR